MTSPLPDVGGPVDFLVGVDNTGNQTGDTVMLTVKLPPGMRLVGPAFYERGSGCTMSATMVCNLGFLAGGSSTLIRFEVQVTRGGPQIMTASVAFDGTDANPADNTSSFVVNLSPPKIANAGTGGLTGSYDPFTRMTAVVKVEPLRSVVKL